MNTQNNQTPKWKSALWVLSVSVAYFIIANLSLKLIFQPEGIAAIWPPDGIFLSSILLSRRNVRPYLAAALFVTDFVAEMLAGIPLNVSLVYSFSLTCEAVLSSWLLIRFIGEPITFDKAKNVFSFLFLSVILVNALISSIAAAAPYFFMGASYWSSWKWWWISDGIGNLLVTPLILGWANSARNGLKDWSTKRTIEAAILFISMILVNYFEFEFLSGQQQFSYYLNYLTFPFLIWAALRFGITGVSTAVIILSAIIIHFTLTSEVVTFANVSKLNSVMAVQMYLAIMSFSFLFLASVITEQKKTAKALQKSEEKFRGIFEQSLTAIEIYDKTGKLIDVNRSCLDIFGINNIESVRAFKLFEDQNIKEDFKKKLTVGENVEFESIFDFELVKKAQLYETKKSGKIYVNILIIPLKTEKGEINGYLVHVRDITERKHVEEELAKNRAMLIKAQELGHVGSWEWDILTNELNWSKETFVIYGLDPGIDAPTYDLVINTLAPECKNDFLNAIDDALKGRKPFDGEYNIILQDGTRVYTHTKGEVVYNSEGHPVRFYGMVQDITERKKAENEIRRLNSELEGRVIERTAQLEATNKELQAFSYSVSHDLRAPLRSIDGFTQAIAQEYQDKLDESGRDYINRVRNSVKKMSDLIEAMLSLSRLTRSEIKYETVDLSQMAKKISFELKAREPGRKVEFIIQEGVKVNGDAQMFNIVLDNLLGNAWKFTSRHPTARIEFGEKVVEGKPAYFVRDDGAGFEMEYAEKLFTAFQRLHTPEQFPGIGIGLATVQRIIHRHGGKTWAEGDVEKGATFYFTLPGG